MISTWISRPFLVEARIILQDVPRQDDNVTISSQSYSFLTGSWHPWKVIFMGDGLYCRRDNPPTPDSKTPWLQGLRSKPGSFLTVAEPKFQMLCIFAPQLWCFYLYIYIYIHIYIYMCIYIYATTVHLSRSSLCKPAWTGIAYFQRC